LARQEQFHCTRKAPEAKSYIIRKHTHKNRKINEIDSRCEGLIKIKLAM